MFTVFCRTRFVGFHRWKDAPKEVKFLREYHRHEFHVEIEVVVAHENRGVEFTLLKLYVKEFLDEHYKDKQFESSCELIAYEVACFLHSKAFKPYKVSVSEDGENGGNWIKETGIVPGPSRL